MSQVNNRRSKLYKKRLYWRNEAKKFLEISKITKKRSHFEAISKPIESH